MTTPTIAVPDDVTDRLLWRDAHAVLNRHQTYESNVPGQPVGECAQCRQLWPCQPYQDALRADQASRAPCPAGMTARHDTLSAGGARW